MHDTMQFVFSFLAVTVVCVGAFPVMFLAYTDGRAETQRAKLLDCAPPTDNSPPSFRCRPVHERSPNKPVLPSPEKLPILEIIEDDLDGMTVVEVGEELMPRLAPLRHASMQERERPIDSSFVITVPEQADHDRPRCAAREVYVSELDICVDLEGHQHPANSAPVVSDNSTPQPFDPTQPLIIKVGHEKREECPEGEIFVPEIGICSEIDPVILPAKHTKKKHSHDTKHKHRRHHHQN